MRFIVNSQSFSKQLQVMSGVITNNNAVPIINCFYFELEEKVLTVKATDLETTLVCKIELEEGKVENISKIAVPAKQLLDTLKSLDDVPMQFAVDANNFNIEITSGEGRYNFQGQDAEQFPAMPKVEGSAVATMNADTLVTAINKTSFAASNDEMRKQMAGIFMKFNENTMTVVATDAHKLVRFRNNEVSCTEDKEIILPRKPITLIKNILAARKEEGEVTLEFNPSNVSFSIGNFFAICQLVEGKYPNIEAAIPKENPNHLVVERLSFLNTLRRVSLFANQSTHQVRLSMTDRQLQVSAEDLEFSNNAKENMICEYEGGPMEIGFNARFLLEMVNNLDTERIRIEMSHPSRAGIIFPVYEEETAEKMDILMLVMPVMLAN